MKTLQTELKEVLRYESETGKFIHLKTHRTVKAGHEAGHCDVKHRYGYRRISFKGKYHQAHRLAYLYMWGYIPEGEVDHINHITNDNRWSNLRIVTHQENGKNQRKYKNNKSGITGIRQRSNGKWRARIYHKGKHVDLGTFADQDIAIAARKKAEVDYKFHSEHGK